MNDPYLNDEYGARIISLNRLR